MRSHYSACFILTKGVSAQLKVSWLIKRDSKPGNWAALDARVQPSPDPWAGHSSPGNTKVADRAPLVGLRAFFSLDIELRLLLKQLNSRKVKKGIRGSFLVLG